MTHRTWSSPLYDIWPGKGAGLCLQPRARTRHIESQSYTVFQWCCFLLFITGIVNIVTPAAGDMHEALLSDTKTETLVSKTETFVSPSETRPRHFIPRLRPRPRRPWVGKFYNVWLNVCSSHHEWSDLCRRFSSSWYIFYVSSLFEYVTIFAVVPCDVID